MLRSIGAVIVGYVVYLVLSVIGGVILAVSFPGAVSQGTMNPTVGFLVGGLVFSVIFAFAGGYVTASIAQTKEVTHALILGGVMVVIGLISLVVGTSPQPVWAQIVGLIIPLPSVYVGGVLRSRRSVPVTATEQAPV